MLDPAHHSRVIAIDDPLPPCWLRVRPTEPDGHARAGQVLRRTEPTGAFRDELVQTVARARDVVVLASFLLTDAALADALIAAATRGRRVYVLTASEAHLQKVISEDDVFDARMIAEHKKLLDRMAGAVVLRSADHFHAKLLVVDPDKAPSGWLSTANFNKALEDSVELGVALSGAACRTAAGWFAWAFWMEAERELSSKGRLAKVRPSPAVPERPTASAIVATARDETSLAEAALRVIRSADRELVVSSYGLSAQHEVVQAIVERARSGVATTVMTRPRPAVAEAVAALAEAGANVLAHDKLHAKAILNEREGMVMSANLEESGLDHGFELGLILAGEDVQELRRTLKDWTVRFPWRYAASVPRSGHLGEICLADAGLRTGRREVVAKEEVALAPVQATSALALEDVPDPQMKAPEPVERYPQQIEYTWDVVAPRLPGKAKELTHTVLKTEKRKGKKDRTVAVQEPYDPPAFELKKQKFVVLEDESRIDDARALADELDAKVVIR